MTESLINNEVNTSASDAVEETNDNAVQTDLEDAIANATDGGEDSADTDEPELIFGKYKDMEAATSAFKELESQIGKLKRERMPEAPEEYNLDFSEDAELADMMKDYNLKEDPLMEAMLPVFKEANITDEQARGLIKAQLMFNKLQDMDAESYKKAELEKLGSEYESINTNLVSYAKRNLTPEEQETFMSLASNAEAFKLLNKLIDKPSAIPTKANETTGIDKSELEAKARAMRADPNFFTNQDLQKRYNDIMVKLI